MKYLVLALPLVLAYCMAIVQVTFHAPLIRDRLMTSRIKILWALGRFVVMLVLFGGIALLWGPWWPMALLLVASALFFQVWFNRTIAFRMGQHKHYLGNTGFFDTLILVFFTGESWKWVKLNHQHKYKNDIAYAVRVRRAARITEEVESSVGVACVAIAGYLL